MLLWMQHKCLYPASTARARMSLSVAVRHFAGLESRRGEGEAKRLYMAMQSVGKAIEWPMHLENEVA